MIPNGRTKRRNKNVDSRLKISGMTEGASLLSGSTRGLNNLRAKTSGCLIKNFRHDEKGNPRLFFFPSPSEGEGGLLNFATAST